MSERGGLQRPGVVAVGGEPAALPGVGDDDDGPALPVALGSGVAGGVQEHGEVGVRDGLGGVAADGPLAADDLGY